MSTIGGGCLCGQVRYRVDASDARTVVCHCRHCQKQSGSAFATLLVVARASCAIDGELGSYLDHGDSGAAVLRRFCPVCGSAVLNEAAAMPALVAIQAGTLDDVSQLAPQVHLWCSSAQPWVPLPDDLPCLDTQR
jgi:hypothetical protein